MSTTTPINGFTIPALGDSQNIETATHPFLNALDSRLVPRFTNLVSRNSSITSPTEGQLAAVEETKEFYKYDGTTWISGAGRTKVKILYPQFVSQSTDFVVDSDLFVPLEQNSKYLFKTIVIYFSPAGSHFKMKWTVPPGATGKMTTLHKDANSASLFIMSNQDITTQWNGWSTNTNALAFHQSGIITTSSTLGNLQLTWSQLNSSAGSTFSVGGSWIQIWRVS